MGRQDSDALIDLDQWAFGFDVEGVDFHALMGPMEWDRIFGAYLPDPERLAGINATFSLDLPVPGGHVPCAGLTWVGVHPGDRRRGVLRSMIRHHLDEVRRRGEPVSALHAAEQAIYGRFGYGMAGQHLELTVPRGADLREVPGADAVRLRFEHADVQRHADVVGSCYEAARTERPGMVSRNAAAIRNAFADQIWMRREAETLRILIAEGEAGGPARGYALFRRKDRWTGSIPNGEVQVRELVALDAAAARALWSRLVDLDLMGSLHTDDRPTDDPLLTLLVDYRGAKPQLVDGIWLRVVDLPALLSARHYLTDLEIVLEVGDELLPDNAGRWRLKGGPGGATCERTDLPADLALDVRELGAAYLGSLTLDALAAAGLVEERRPGAVGEASRAFCWPVAAYCGWRF
jgi:predicted acetyltransferase